MYDIQSSYSYHERHLIIPIIILFDCQFVVTYYCMNYLAPKYTLVLFQDHSDLAKADVFSLSLTVYEVVSLCAAFVIIPTAISVWKCM